MADLVITRNQHAILCTHPLGACLGVAIYDPVVKAGGLLHAMLPDSTIDAVRAAGRPGMFLNTGLAALLQQAGDLKMTPANLLIYIAGGGRILDESPCFNIGKRNHEVLTSLLEERGLKVCAQDVGGLVNRTLRLNIATGEVRLKISGQAAEKILCKQ